MNEFNAELKTKVSSHVLHEILERLENTDAEFECTMKRVDKGYWEIILNTYRRHSKYFINLLTHEIEK